MQERVRPLEVLLVEDNPGDVRLVRQALSDSSLVIRLHVALLTVPDDTGMDPKWLELELTESILMTQAESVAVVLQMLRERGVGATIDDSGSWAG